MDEQQGEPEQFNAYTDETYASGQVEALDSVEWSASEYVAHQKSGGWFAGFIAATIGITGIVMVVTGPLAAAVVLLSFVALGMFSVRKPVTKTYKITADGVYVDSRFFTYDDFKSFAVMEEGAIDCIWLRPLKRYNPTVAMYYPPNDEERIVMMLQNYLPMEDRVHDLVERISQRLRF